MKESYVLRQIETIYAMAFLMPWDHEAVLAEFQAVLGTDRPVVNLNRLFVAKGKQGKGYGHTLLSHVCQDADREDVILTLSVEPDDPSHYAWIHQMYEHAGFQDHEELGGMVRWPQARRDLTRQRLDSTQSAEDLPVESSPSNTQLVSTP